MKNKLASEIMNTIEKRKKELFPVFEEVFTKKVELVKTFVVTHLGEGTVFISKNKLTEDTSLKLGGGEVNLLEKHIINRFREEGFIVTEYNDDLRVSLPKLEEKNYVKLLDYPTHEPKYDKRDITEILQKEKLKLEDRLKSSNVGKNWKEYSVRLSRNVTPGIYVFDVYGITKE